MSRGRGRPSKLTPELQEKLCGFIRAGNYETTAAEACGVSESTYFNWKAKGEKAQRGKYRDFLEDIKKAIAQAEALHVQRIVNAGSAHWQASAWYLERKHHERWGRKEFRGQLDREGRPTDPPEQQGSVLVVPAHVTDIEEWSKQARDKMKATQVPLDDSPADAS